MIQDARTSLGSNVPKFGASLGLLRKWEHSFRELADARGFTEVNLPVCGPIERFRSRQTGEILLSAGPRFSDFHGMEWALRSDMTAFTVQFVLEHSSEMALPAKLFYAGKVFSYLSGENAQSEFSAGHGLSSGETKIESFEYGAEIIGQEELAADIEAINLALQLANAFGYGAITIVVGDARVAQSLLKFATETLPAAERAPFVEALSAALTQRDLLELHRLLQDARLAEVFEDAVKRSRAHEFLDKLHVNQGTQLTTRFDPWLLRPQKFYSGIVFEIYSEDSSGNLRWLGGGGRYDTLFTHFGRDIPAVGFMMKDPLTTKFDLSLPPSPTRPLRVALPKGRLAKKALELFEKVGVQVEVDLESTRKLVIPSTDGKFEFLLVKNSDVTRYLEEGVCEMGIAGSDVLDEHPSNVLRPATFSFGECRICLAGLPEMKEKLSTLSRPSVASKYVKITRRELRRRGVSCDIIPLQGSVELASVIHMSHAIVDLVETGTTLRENGLIIYDELARTRVQLAVTRGFYYQHHATLEAWLQTWQTLGYLKGAHAPIAGVISK